MAETTLRITETFYSLQGESTSSGLATFFIRLTGCPLRCVYCDTEYAFHGGESIAIPSLLDQAASYKPLYVCVTGGEPLAQPACLELLQALCDAGYRVSLETSGAMAVEAVDERVVVVLDIKTPDSGEVEKNLWDNMQRLRNKDQVKFVIASRIDYDWAKSKMLEFDLPARAGEILFSPVAGQLPPQQLADWILEDRLQVRYQLQLHKLVWGDRPGV